VLEWQKFVLAASTAPSDDIGPSGIASEQREHGIHGVSGPAGGWPGRQVVRLACVGQAGTAWGVVIEPDGGITPGPLASHASAAGSVSSGSSAVSSCCRPA
jgi:hypothetical protein